MYPVSDSFITAINANSCRYTWTGTLNIKCGKSYNFMSEDIVKGSGYIRRQFCGSTKI